MTVPARGGLRGEGVSRNRKERGGCRESLIFGIRFYITHFVFSKDSCICYCIIKVCISLSVDQDASHPRSRSWEAAAQAHTFGVVTFSSFL